MTNLTELLTLWIGLEQLTQLPDDVGSPHETEYDRGNNAKIKDLKSKIPDLIEQIEKILKDRIKKEIIKLEVANKNKPRPDEYQRALTDVIRII